jgi:hypothetical protein
MRLLIGCLAAVILIALYVIYDRRYHGKSGSHLQATGERFRDPATGKMMRVYEDPRTGAREYVSEDE